MKILIFEYITGGGLIGQALPKALVQEGEMMLASVVEDFAQLSNMQVSVLKDYRLAKNNDNEIIVNSNMSFDTKLQKVMEDKDALLIIAPETNDVLASLCEKFSKHACLLLNSKTKDIRLTANKYKTYKYLQEYSILQVPTYLASDSDISEIQKYNSDYVIKSVDGVGCEGLIIFKNYEQLHEVLANKDKDQYIIQPYIYGTHVSLSLLCWDGEALLLSANEQCFAKQNDTLILQKCVVNAFERKNFESFAKQVIQAFSGLCGYIGLDLIVTENDTYLVEVNPRLTTSYAGIKSALGINPAQLIMQCFENKRIPNIEFELNNNINVKIEARCVA